MAIEKDKPHLRKGNGSWRVVTRGAPRRVMPPPLEQGAALAAAVSPAGIILHLWGWGCGAPFKGDDHLGDPSAGVTRRPCDPSAGPTQRRPTRWQSAATGDQREFRSLFRFCRLEPVDLLLDIAEDAAMGLTEVWARNLRAAREARGLSQHELSLMAGCARTTVSDHERDIKDPGLKTMERIAAALGLEVVELLRDENGGDAEAARSRFVKALAQHPGR